jgi:hypothetical protein
MSSTHPVDALDRYLRRDGAWETYGTQVSKTPEKRDALAALQTRAAAAVVEYEAVAKDKRQGSV